MERRNFLKQGTIAAAGIAFLNSTAALASTSDGSHANASKAPTQFITAGGIKFAYRRFGKKNGLPVVFTNYLTGTMDNWDPLVLNAIATDREVIIFDNAGVAASEGQTPDNIAAMANDALSFIHALELKKIDLFGFSIGGMVAQQVTLDEPELIRRLILVGTGPRGGEGMQDYTPEVWAMFKKKYEHADELLLDTFFTTSASSQKAGRAYLSRIRARVNKEPELAATVVPAQLSAIFGWGKMPAENYTYLSAITQPVLVLHGDKDIICPPVNAYILKQHLPDAQLIIYPDTNHSPQNQMPVLFNEHVKVFLDAI
ncbi:Tat (twin-arginine translocation) pathway signal sequence [Pedobacter westerhofensis]|uniref:Tat (Twin-arginine translocation) pathway signal sequence n=1 Tax=Pedobacter westerhofensis TaxID=425512 RepID=A0A521BRK4_9SPHI|nr:alpha/beta hydrolase [Pedobacter westerhofensis]SMO49361.1 Tat (twin-arginine translocation) pathway signal sequence [Pedobacter westerhofensis]